MKTWLKAFVSVVLLLMPVARSALAASMPSATDATGSVLYSGALPGAVVVQGSSATVTELQIVESGMLSFTLTEKNFPATLGSLALAVSNADTALKAMDGAGTMHMAISGPETLYLNVFATAQGPANIGLYNLQINFTPAVAVPIPASGWLLGAALLIWQLLKRRSRPRTYNCHTSYGLMSAC